MFLKTIRPICLTVSLILTIIPGVMGQPDPAAVESQYFYIHKARSEILLPHFHYILRALPISKNRIVIFSRGEQYTNGTHDYLGIFGSSLTIGGESSYLLPFFKGHGGSWGAFEIDAVWPEGAKRGVMFAAISYDYDGSKPYFGVAKFDHDGHPVGKPKKIISIDVLNNVDNSWIAATVGPESIGVAMSYMKKDWQTGMINSMAYFVEFTFKGKQIGDLIPIKIKNSGKDRYVRVFRPLNVDGEWIVPASGYRNDAVNDVVLANELLLGLIKNNKGRFKRIATDHQSDGPSYASAQFLAPADQNSEVAGVDNSILFVQHRNYLPYEERKDKKYEPEYLTFEISSSGKVLEGPVLHQSEQWDVDFASKYSNTFLSYYYDVVTEVQPIKQDKYLLAVLRYTEQTTADKYQFSYSTGDMYLGILNLQKKEIKVVRRDLYIDQYPYRLNSDAMTTLLPLEAQQSWLLLEGTVESVVDSRHWLDVVMIEKSDFPTRPDDRADHAMVYSDSTDTVLLFGGASGATHFNDLWEWNGENWRQLTSGGTDPAAKAPKPRARHAMAFDSKRGVAVLFGGKCGSRTFGDTWEWDGSQWQCVSKSGPLAREGHAMVFAEDRGVVVLFGGRNGDTFYDDVWEWDGQNWTMVSSDGPIEPRAEHGMAWDAKCNKVLVFGGFNGTAALGDTWYWDSTQWSLVSSGGPWYDPSPRSGAALTYDSKKKRIFLFGGYDKDGFTKKDAYFWNGSSWIRYYVYPITWVPPRAGHALAYDKKRHNVLLFGGWTPTEVNGETWIWDGKDWFNIMP